MRWTVLDLCLTGLRPQRRERGREKQETVSVSTGRVVFALPEAEPLFLILWEGKTDKTAQDIEHVFKGKGKRPHAHAQESCDGMARDTYAHEAQTLTVQNVMEG